MKFLDGSGNYLRGPIQLLMPLYSQLTLRMYVPTNRVGGGAQTDIVPGGGKP